MMQVMGDGGVHDSYVLCEGANIGAHEKSNLKTEKTRPKP